jgi:hypothetical protein
MIVLLAAALMQDPAAGRAAAEPTLVSLAVESAPLKQVLERLSAQAPHESATCDREIEGRLVRADIERKPFFEALHLVCVQNEGIYLDVGEELRLREGRYVPAATFCAGPYVFQVRALRMARSVQGAARRELELRVAARSERHVTPVLEELILREFGDRDVSRSGEDAPVVPEPWSAVVPLLPARGTRLRQLPGDEISPGRKRLDIFGEARAYFIRESASVEVAVPETDGEAERPAADPRFKVLVERKGETLNVELQYEFQADQEGGLWPLCARLFRPTAIELLSADGNALAPRSSGDGSGRKNYSRRFSYDMGDEAPAKVRVTLPKTIDRQVIPIKFKGLSLE